MKTLAKSINNSSKIVSGFKSENKCMKIMLVNKPSNGKFEGDILCVINLCDIHVRYTGR